MSKKIISILYIRKYLVFTDISRENKRVVSGTTSVGGSNPSGCVKYRESLTVYTFLCESFWITVIHLALL